MTNVLKSATVVGKLIGLLMGNGFTTPAVKVYGKNPYINQL